MKAPPVLCEVHRSVWGAAVDLEKILELVWRFDCEVESLGFSRKRFSSQTYAKFLH